MEYMKKNKKKVLLIIAAVLLITMGITFAYFTVFSDAISRTEVDTSFSAEARLEFFPGDSISLYVSEENSGIGEDDLSSSTNPTVVLTYPDAAADKYNTYINIYFNEFVYTSENNEAELVLVIKNELGEYITEIDGLEKVTVDGITGFDVTTETGLFEVALDTYIEKDATTESVTHTWTFEVYFVNLDSNQMDNGGNEFSLSVIQTTKYLNSLSEYLMDLSGTTQGNGAIVQEIATELDTMDYDFYTNIEISDTESYTWNDNDKEWTGASSGSFSFSPSESGDYYLFYDVTTVGWSDYAYIYVNGSQVDSAAKNSTGYILLSSLKTTDVVKITYSKSSYYFPASYSIVFSMTKAYSDDTTLVDAGYRFEGANPNNYISFNDELWRIIGVFETETADGETEYLTKIIKNDSIDYLSWDKADQNDWSDSSAYETLNYDYFNSSGTYENAGIYDNARNYIENVVWNLGGARSNYLTAEGFYLSERSGTVYLNNETTVTGYVGLMYISDYAYAALSSSCSRSVYVYNYSSYSSCYTSNWLYTGETMWTMVSFSNASDYAWLIYAAANASTTYSHYSYAIIPVVYLKANTTYSSGDGSINDPYEIIYED